VIDDAMSTGGSLRDAQALLKARTHHPSSTSCPLCLSHSVGDADTGSASAYLSSPPVRCAYHIPWVTLTPAARPSCPGQADYNLNVVGAFYLVDRSVPPP
jgi:hypothetical protein